ASAVHAAGAAAVLAALRARGARSAEEVAAASCLAPGAVLAALLDLELAGRVKRLRGGAWRRAKISRRNAARSGDPGAVTE
ncbi:MAG: hypothetical protein JOZ15_06895, partial [Acidobacteria bacterium]|nr:hypothetical protein [Acidobacteriota bacterium]